MGIYINPKDGRTKEQWLADHGTPINATASINHDYTGDYLPVCWVDNGWMTAAGIAYDAREAECFRNPGGRPTAWFMVRRDLLKQFDSERNPVI